jgi:hypothetical protein
MRKLLTVSALLVLAQAAHAAEPPQLDIRDPLVKAWYEAAPSREPMPPAAGSWGLVGPNGSFVHPKETPEDAKSPTFPGEMTDWDGKQYIHNMKVEAFHPIVVEPFHTWMNIVDFDGRRYMYHYVRRTLKIYDITDPRRLKVLLEKGSSWSKDGESAETNPFPKGDMFGAATIAWDAKRGKYVMVQAFEVRRFGILKDKRFQPDKVAEIRNADHLRGFKVYEMNGPLPDQWTLIAETTTDTEHPDAPIEKQQGSGALDVPAWFGGKYMFLAAAPNDRYALNEYQNYLFSAGYQAWDMTDPAHPKFVGQFTAPQGQMVGDPAQEAAYRANPHAGNRITWMGARMPLFIPKPVEQGGKYGYAALGGLGFSVVDISDPAHMKTVGHLDLPPAVSGTEGDNIDVSQVETTGLVYLSGYAVNANCYEPYQEIYVIDVRDPAHPKQVGTLPRPMPPNESGLVDYCQRRGVFGPKRSGYFYTQPGRGRVGVLPYAFQTAGVQLFDVRDPRNPKIGAYFVPKYDTSNLPSYGISKLANGIYVEYDRNLLWLITNHGLYVLSSPLLGKPSFDMPKQPWPAHG